MSNASHQHPLFEAWETMYCSELPGNMHPKTVARMLLHDSNFPERIDPALFARCVDEIKEGGTDIYSEEIVECMDYLARYHLHGQGD
ncbi:MAG: hypothetical protein HYV54_01105 [Parcubacteria group bacterium]|nr:hypothetical protein [Parcubacteria group bacterium]